MNDVPVITVDGPTASGKGTIAQRVAELLQFHYLDSGVLYRLVAWRTSQTRVNADDSERVAYLASTLQPQFFDRRVVIDGRDVTEVIRSEEVSRLASRVAVHGSVRQALLDLQRAQRRSPGLVADGRDMGTVVFPDACLKIFLTAGLSARAARRYNQLIEKGFSATIAAPSQDQIEQEIRLRDQRDSERSAAPLKPAHDACMVDSSDLSVEEVVALVLGWSRERLQRKQSN